MQKYLLFFIILMGCYLFASQADAYMLPMYALSASVDYPHPGSATEKAFMFLETEPDPDQPIHTIPDSVQPGIMFLLGLLMMLLAKVRKNFKLMIPHSGTRKISYKTPIIPPVE
jgi:hypothetical protein